MAAEAERDPVVEREAEAAAREAGAIGGRRPPGEPDTAERPVSEGGGGEAEGFEQAEESLREHAEHGEGGADPLSDRPEPEPDRDAAAHGEADHVRSTEAEADTAGE
jgi:hypothetical protein